MEPKIRALVQSIHDSPGRIAVVTAGAGTQAVSWLLGVPGASRTIMEALIPYGKPAFNDFLGRPPHKYVAPKTVQWMSGRALTRARVLADPAERVLGLACTAAIITDRPKRGDHRAYISTWTTQAVTTHYLKLAKGARDREGEEALVSRVMLNALASAYGVDAALPLALQDGDLFETEISDLAQAVQALYDGTSRFVGVYDTGKIRTKGIRPKLLFPGSFNPLHDGHLQLARSASTYLSMPVAFELSVGNVDKRAIPVENALARLSQFAGRYPVYLTNAPTFLEKARVFPAVTFIVGYDTAARILEPRYYADFAGGMAELLDLDCHFLVAGRVGKDGVYHDFSNLTVPDAYRDLFVPLPNFRNDISSTELREQGLVGSR